jgi:hypothetical protein
MPDEISWIFQDAAQCYFHIYRINNSAVAEVMHSHNFYQICYVSHGEIYHRQQGEEVQLTYGDAFIVPPGFIHSIAFPKRIPRSILFPSRREIFQAGFSYSNVYNFMTALNLDTAGEKRVDVRLKLKLDESQRMVLKMLLDCLIRESATQCPKELSACGSLIASILCIISQAYFAQPQSREKLQNIEESTKSIEQCIRYIDQNYMHPVSLGDLPRKFALSRSAFSMLFQRISGKPLKRYITQKRIEQATALIQLDNT